MAQFMTALLGGLGIGAVFALVALGFAFILRTTDSFNFAQGQLVPIGSLLAYTFYTALGWPAALAIVILVVITGLVGGLTERVAVFPLARRGDNDILLWVMSTLGVTAILTGIALRLWGSEPLGVSNYVGPRVTHFGQSYVATPYILAFVFAILVAIGIDVFQRHTRWGKLMRAIADNRNAVQLAGVNTLTFGLVAYVIGAALAGIAGFAIAPITYASATGGFTFTILGFAALAMGGFGSHWGALLGGLMVGVIQSLSATYFGLVYQDFAVFGTLILVLMIRPDGIFGFAQTRKV
jgi:branched-chain amino acid transport system permease protein